MIRLLLPLALFACDNSVKVDDTAPVVADDSQPTNPTDDTDPPTDDTDPPTDDTDPPTDDDSGTTTDDDSGTGPLDTDGDGSLDADDCAPTDPAIFPGAAETCDSVDQDCNGLVDDGSPGTYADADADGFGSTAITNVCETGVATGDDCDDADALTYPGAEEACDDPADRNCDGVISLVDADGDGVAECLDCNDGDPGAYPGAAELCDGLDQDCDGEVDNDPVDGLSAFLDSDGDGFGGDAVSGCELPADTVSVDGDCDDTLSNVNPDGTETCDGIDEDCDGSIDEDVSGANATYADADGDGYGIGSAMYECVPSPGRAITNGDCDDTDDSVSPASEEVCNSADDDCDTAVDEDAVDATTYFLDVDGDTYGSDASSVTSCTVPSGVAFTGGDCDESDDTINPGADEYCDSIDNDCDGNIDDSPVDGVTYYPDADRDGWGADAVTGCSVPDASSASSGDCDDTSAAAYPGADELCNGADDDCDGNIDDAGSTWYNDADGDGFGDATTASGLCTPGTGQTSDDTDCDDTAASTYPGATEQCDGIDNNCDGNVDDGAVPVTWYADVDGDGYGDPSSTTLDCTQPSGSVEDDTDCDDTDAAINPGAMEVCDGDDNNCDSLTDPDFFNSTLDSAETQWVFNGDAYQNLDSSDGFFRLTEEAADLTGTVWFSVPVPTDALHIQFTMLSSESVRDDNNGEGLTLSFLDGTDTSVIGNGTTQMGAGGLSGYAVEFDEVSYASAWWGTYPTTDRTVGVTELSAWTSLDDVSIDNDYINDVEASIDVYFDRGDVFVYIDGDMLFDYTISGYATDTVTIGFTAATGTEVNGYYDPRASSYDIDDVVIGCE